MEGTNMVGRKRGRERVREKRELRKEKEVR